MQPKYKESVYKGEHLSKSEKKNKIQKNIYTFCGLSLEGLDITLFSAYIVANLSWSYSFAPVSLVPFLIILIFYIKYANLIYFK